MGNAEYGIPIRVPRSALEKKRRVRTAASDHASGFYRPRGTLRGGTEGTGAGAGAVWPCPGAVKVFGGGAPPGNAGSFPGRPGVFPGRPGVFPGKPGVFPGRPGVLPGNPGGVTGTCGGGTPGGFVMAPGMVGSAPGMPAFGGIVAPGGQALVSPETPLVKPRNRLLRPATPFVRNRLVPVKRLVRPKLVGGFGFVPTMGDCGKSGARSLNCPLNSACAQAPVPTSKLKSVSRVFIQDR